MQREAKATHPAMLHQLPALWAKGMSGDAVHALILMMIPEPGYTPANLRAILAQRGWRRETAAYLLGVSVRAVHRWCVDTDNPNHRDMSLKHWRRLIELATGLLQPDSKS